MALVRVGFAPALGVGLLDLGRTEVTQGIWGSIAVEDEVAVVVVMEFKGVVFVG